MKAKTNFRRILSLVLSVSLAITLIASINQVGSSAEIATNTDGLLFAKWDGVNGQVVSSNPSGATYSYLEDGSVSLSFTGNNSNPENECSLEFNPVIAKKALEIALNTSKKLEFKLTYTGGKDNSNASTLFNQLDVYLNNSKQTVSFIGGYARIHHVVLDVSALDSSTTFDSFTLDIVAKNYYGSGFKDSAFTISPIYVQREDITGTFGFEKPVDEFIKGIRVGWNLGNTLDNVNSNYINQRTPNQIETLSGNNPVTTQAMIDKVKSAGFNAVRMPVSWMMFITKDSNGTISVNSAWITRIKQIIDYCYNNNMYVIINIHHDDNHWLNISKTGSEWVSVKDQFEQLWDIIANEFKDYDARLMFEAANEVIYRSGSNVDWWGYSQSYFDKMNELYSIFVNSVRSSGGNNALRYLILPTYGAQYYEHQMQKVIIPNNDDRIIIDMHWYTTSYTQSALGEFLNTAYSYFISRGTPVIMGECGMSVDKTNELKTNWSDGFIGLMDKWGIKCFLWDDGGNFRILNRSALTWTSNSYVNAAVATAKVNKSFEVIKINQKAYTGSAITPSVQIFGKTEGVDYTVEYANNINVGTGIAYILGKGDYAGYWSSITFEIVNSSATIPEVTTPISKVYYMKDYNPIVRGGSGNLYSASSYGTVNFGTVTIKGLRNLSSTGISLGDYLEFSAGVITAGTYSVSVSYVNPTPSNQNKMPFTVSALNSIGVKSDIGSVTNTATAGSGTAPDGLTETIGSLAISQTDSFKFRFTANTTNAAYKYILIYKLSLEKTSVPTSSSSTTVTTTTTSTTTPTSIPTTTSSGSITRYYTKDYTATISGIGASQYNGANYNTGKWGYINFKGIQNTSSGLTAGDYYEINIGNLNAGNYSGLIGYIGGGGTQTSIVGNKAPFKVELVDSSNNVSLIKNVNNTANAVEEGLGSFSVLSSGNYKLRFTATATNPAYKYIMVYFVELEHFATSTTTTTTTTTTTEPTTSVSYNQTFYTKDQSINIVGTGVSQYTAVKYNTSKWGYIDFKGIQNTTSGLTAGDYYEFSIGTLSDGSYNAEIGYIGGSGTITNIVGNKMPFKVQLVDSANNVVDIANVLNGSGGVEESLGSFSLTSSDNYKIRFTATTTNLAYKYIMVYYLKIFN